jgi:hypothetical protein
MGPGASSVVAPGDALTLCTRRSGGVLFNQVTDILHWGIPEHWRRRFKLKERRDNMRGFEAGYRVVLRLLHSVLREIDPSPLPKNRACSSPRSNDSRAKHWQSHFYGGREWRKIYPRLRNSVEDFNGYAKDDAHEAIERAQNRRIRGIATQTFLLAFQLAAANLRKISSWLDGLATDDGGPRRRARRRKTRSLSEFAPSRRLDDAA